MRNSKKSPDLHWERVVALHQQDGAVSQACADIFKMISLDDAHRDARTLLFTSALHGEGKTTMALHLAAMLAARGRQVLLADVHWQRPTLGRVLGVADRPGLTDLLAGGSRQDELLVKDAKLPRLSVLPRGKRNVDLVHGSFDERLAAILANLRGSFDCVILDGAPAASGPEVLILSRLVDAVVLVVACGQTQQNQVAAARQTIERNGGKLAGVILNRVPRYLPDYYRTV